MRVSVILSTYNSPDWLAKVLWGYANQTHREFEVVIADDGSTDATKKRIEELRQETNLTIQHVWHPDRGFRKCTILNRAIEAANGDYLIFSDGDCIPRADFVATHVALAAPNRFLSGGLYRLPMQLSHQIKSLDISTGRFAKTSWLRKNGVAANLKLLKLVQNRALATLLDKTTFTRATWNGHNASTWKADLVAVNGFDERMEYGAEDRELGERLIHRGLKPLRIRHRAVVMHLDHSRGYVNDAAWKKNREIWAETLRTHTVWTDFGIKQRATENTASKSTQQQPKAA